MKKHFTKSGDAHMVDINDKDITDRIAVASGKIYMSNTSVKKIKEGNLKKGDALAAARIAGIMAAKKTSELIPLCHPLPITKVNVIIEPDKLENLVLITATVGQTGVEMEALTAVQIGLLTIYDMCKSIDRSMIITDIQLESKKGGASGEWKRAK